MATIGTLFGWLGDIVGIHTFADSVPTALRRRWNLRTGFTVTDNPAQQWLDIDVTAAAGGGEAALAPDWTEPANAAGRTGVYTEAAMVYDSTLDATVTGLSARVCYDDGVAAALGTDPMPILLLLHGYAGDESDWSQAFMREAADKGYFVIACAKRGDLDTPHSTGGADDCRDIHDYYDAIAAAVTAYPTIVDGAIVDILGVSGGSYAALCLVARHHGRFRNVVASQLGGDLGVNPATTASYWGYAGVGATRTEIEDRAGDRSDPGDGITHYRARNAHAALVDSLNQSTTKLIILWDDEDTIGITMRHTRDLLTAAVPVSRWYAEESTDASDRQWEHGYPEDAPDLYLALYAMTNLAGDAPAAASRGQCTVAGYTVSAAGWECWALSTTAAAPDNVRDHAGGGTNATVRVDYDAESGQFYVQRLDAAKPFADEGTLACYVTIVWNDLSLTLEVPA